MSKDRAGSYRPPAAEGRGAAAILDGALGFVVVILVATVVPMIAGGFRPEMLLLYFGYAGLMLLLGRTRGWSVGKYVRRLRTPPDHEARADRASAA